MAETLRFDGEVAVVTGAGRGMGRTHALELARRGAKVVVNDIQGAGEIAGEIRAAGGEAVADDHSVATAEGGQAIIGLALSTWGRLDSVVANATIYLPRPFDEMTLADFDAVLDVKLRAAFFVFHPAYLHMKQAGGGRLVGVTSGAGLHRARGHGDDIRAGFLPERVSPMVAVLAHRTCPCTGQILGAWGGRFARSTITTARGWVSGQPPTAEDVAGHWDEIVDQNGAVDYPNDIMIFAYENMRLLYGR
jgi:hypothetical protein